MDSSVQNKEIFEREINTCFRQLYAIAKIHLNNSEDVNDVVQDTLLLAFKNYNSLRKKEYFKTWITKILLNQIKKQYKKQDRCEYCEPQEFVCGDPVKTEDVLLLNSCIKRCDYMTQQVLILKYYADYTFHEISRILHIPLGTAKSKCYRGLNEIKKMLGEEK